MSTEPKGTLMLLKPDPLCAICHGVGQFLEDVIGEAWPSPESYPCECVEKQIPDELGTDYEVLNLELTLKTLYQGPCHKTLGAGFGSQLGIESVEFFNSNAETIDIFLRIGDLRWKFKLPTGRIKKYWGGYKGIPRGNVVLNSDTLRPVTVRVRGFVETTL